MDPIHHRCMVVRKSIKYRVCPPLQQALWLSHIVDIKKRQQRKLFVTSFESLAGSDEYGYAARRFRIRLSLLAYLAGPLFRHGRLHVIALIGEACRELT